MSHDPVTSRAHLGLTELGAAAVVADAPNENGVAAVATVLVAGAPNEKGVAAVVAAVPPNGND